jgi:hypothetical protein
LPTAVLIGDTEYPIETDFRTCLKVILAFEDTELTAFEKQGRLIDLLYPKKPDDLQEAFRIGVKFLDGGKATDEDEDTPLRLYSCEKDANLIFAAFKQTHGIDLETADLHWWKFLALFMDLGADTVFCNLVSLRKRIKTGKATKEEKEAASEMGEMFEIPEFDTRTPEERDQEAEFMRMVGVNK